MAKCIIVGAGEFDRLYEEVCEGDFVIAADGGYDNLESIGARPDLLLGDMDSIVSSYKDDIPKVILPCMKDDTDTLAAIRVGFEKGYDSFSIYGAFGGRLDHTIANIQCLSFILDRGGHGIIYGKHCALELVRDSSVSYDKDNHGYISVFAFGGAARGVTERGLKYEVDSVTLTPSLPIGVSNEFIGKESYIEVKDGTIIIYREGI